MIGKLSTEEIRKLRVRKKLRGIPGRPRLCVVASLQHIYAQVIDDNKGATLASASTLSPELAKQAQTVSKTEAAKKVGALIAQKAKTSGVSEVVFDRGSRLYHGRIKALAEAAKEGGLKF